MKKILKGSGIVFLVIILIGMFSGGSDNSNSNTANVPTQRTTSTGNNQPTVKTYKVGDEAVVKDVKWKLTKAWEAELLYDYSGAVKPAGKFVVVNVTVENLGKEMKTATGLKLVDSQNREFVSYSKSFGLKNLGAESLYLLSNLNPNVPYTFADVYEVPADVRGLKLKVGDLSLLGSDEALIDLGL